MPRKLTDRTLALMVASACEEKKALDVVCLDVSKRTFITGYFVVCTSESPRQSRAIAEAAEQSLKANGYRMLGHEGYEDGEWLLADFGDVVLHVFSPELRRFYAIESIWSDAKRVTPPARKKTAAR